MTTYTDFDTSFDKHPITGDIVFKTDVSAIQQSVKNLVLLNFYEKPFHHEMGSNVKRLLFEPISPITSINLSNAISEVIRNYEPRVELINIEVDPRYDTNAYDIRIEFNLLNNETAITTQFLLHQVR